MILGWLKQEYQTDGEGFWSNRHHIQKSYEDGHLWVIREEGDAVAFQVGDYSAEVLCVRKDRRRHGFGQAMFEASLARAMEDSVNVLTVECSPASSLPFWKGHGFKLYKDNAFSQGPIVRRILHREYDLPESIPKVEVAITFFPEAILHNPKVLPLIDDKMCGALHPNDEIALPHRVIAHDDYSDHKDLVIKIVVHDNEQYFNKAKYPEAKALGIQKDSIGPSFYIDKFLLEPSESD